jgi:multidrug efflux pump subunit AcrB
MYKTRKNYGESGSCEPEKMPLFYKSLNNLMPTPVVWKVGKTIAKLEGEYKAADLKLELPKTIYNFTLEAADAVVHDYLLQCFLVALYMLFFLHSIRNSLIVMVSIPASLIATFIGIYNEFSLELWVY